MPSKYEVPKKQAQNVRSWFPGVDKNIPVFYSKRGRTVHVSQADCKKGKQNSLEACAKACAIGRELHRQARVSDRMTAILEVNEKGKKVIILYSHTYTGMRHNQKYDKVKKMLDHDFALNAWPKTWFPNERARMAKRRAKRVSAPGYKPRVYKRRRRNPHQGHSRINFLNEKAS